METDERAWADTSQQEEAEWALAEAARAGTPEKAMEVLATHMGLRERLDLIRP